jgi:tetratricopeptide (TPR) repeat protein
LRARARHLDATGNPHQALELWRQLAQLGGAEDSAWMRYAHALIGRDEVTKAKTILEERFAKTEGKAARESLLNSWMDGFFVMGKQARLLELLPALRKILPGFPFHLIEAVCFSRTGRWGEAIPILEKAIKEGAPVHEVLAECYQGLGRLSEALTCAQQSLEEGPSIQRYRLLFKILVAKGEKGWAKEILEGHIQRLEPRAKDLAELRSALG